jgi:hypothetical protein
MDGFDFSQLPQETSLQGAGSAVAALRQFTKRRIGREACDLCAAPLAPEHQHLLDPVARQIVCSCDACAVLFPGQTGAKYRRVPRRIEAWPNFRLSDMHWQSMGIPIGLAFFFRSSVKGQMMVMFPSPAGGTEAELPQDAWNVLADENPVLRGLEDDVEALLVNRVNEARQHYRAPIDKCFELVGLIRTHWRGLSGGSAAWAQIHLFFQALQERAFVVEN